jgi:hypothetical protein
MYRGLQSVKRRQCVNQQQKMTDECKNMEKDEKEGHGNSTGICMRNNNEEEDDEPRTRKRARKDNNKLTRNSGEESECGGKDHKRISSSKCPWKGQGQEVVTHNYEQRMAMNNGSLRCFQTTTAPTGDPNGESEVEVESTSK